jgi:hypothetical protein
MNLFKDVSFSAVDSHSHHRRKLGQDCFIIGKKELSTT